MTIATAESFEHIVDILCDSPRLACDTETTGLYPFHGDRLFSIIFATETDEYYFDFNIGGLPHSDIPKLQAVFDNAKHLYFCNAKFDLSMLFMSGITLNSAAILDLPAMARVEFSKHKSGFMSLDYLAKYYLKHESKDKTVEDYIKKNKLYGVDHIGKKKPRYDLVPIDIMKKYACKDARLTYDIGQKIISNLNYKDSANIRQRPETFLTLMDLLKNETHLTRVLFNMKLKGLKIDRDYINRAVKHESEIIEKEALSVKLLMGEKFNHNSHVQVKKYLLGNGYQVADTEYNTIKDIDLPLIKPLISLKKAAKKCETYYKNFLNLADEVDVLHCEVNQEAASTGRTSSSSPNLQNLTKEDYHDYAVRNSFIARHDTRLIFMDYKQQEMLYMLDQAGEMPVIEKVKSGLDFYTATGEVIKEITGVELSRAKAKAISLGLAYGEGKNLLAKNLGCSGDDATRFKKAYFKGLPKLKNLQAYLEKQVEYYGKIHNPFGRITYLKSNENYKALNAFVQGSCADITKKAMVNCHDYLLRYKSELLLTVHDELIFEVPIAEMHVVSMLRDIMIASYPYKHLPLGIDVEISRTSWAAKKPLKNLKAIPIA